MDAFTTFYETISDRPKDPELCRLAWEAGRASRDAELRGQEPLAFAPAGKLAGAFGAFAGAERNPDRHPTPLYGKPIPPPDVRALEAALRKLLAQCNHISPLAGKPSTVKSVRQAAAFMAACSAAEKLLGGSKS